MTIDQLNAGNVIQQDIDCIKTQIQTWEESDAFANDDIRLYDSVGKSGTGIADTSYIDFERLKKDTIERLETKLATLEEDFAKL